MNLNATILGQAIAFVFFVFFCMEYVWPPLISAIERRQREIADTFAAAEQASKDLKIAELQAIDHLKQAKIQAKEIIEQANNLKRQVLDKAKIEAKFQSNKIMTQAQAEIEAERKRAQEKLRKQVAALALAGAERIIEHSVNEPIDYEIIDKIVAEL